MTRIRNPLKSLNIASYYGGLNISSAIDSNQLEMWTQAESKQTNDGEPAVNISYSKNPDRLTLTFSHECGSIKVEIPKECLTSVASYAPIVAQVNKALEEFYSSFRWTPGKWKINNE